MKRLMCCILLLAMLCGGSALAEIGNRLKVVNCDEYVTLRSWPDTSADALAKVPLGKTVDEIHEAGNGFLCVSYRGQTGYVLERYLRVAEDYSGSRVKLSAGERYNINLFLSNFTEAGFVWNGCYDDSRTDEALLTDFAIEHCWFNRQNRLEWGDYFGGNNVRLPRDQIAPIVKKYFGKSITPSKSVPYIDYKDGYYYWEETGGHTDDGFACLTRIEQVGRTRYSVWFDIYGMGYGWDNDVCYYTRDEARQAYPLFSGGDAHFGHAVIDVGSSGLSDREDWKLERYTACYGE